MNYKLNIYSSFEITGKGTIFTVHRDENNIEGIKKGSTVETNDGKQYNVIGIETFKNNFGNDGKSVGLLVTEINK
jgi:translation elongation factor EF-Tu-like GTPase